MKKLLAIFLYTENDPKQKILADKITEHLNAIGFVKEIHHPENAFLYGNNYNLVEEANCTVLSIEPELLPEILSEVLKEELREKKIDTLDAKVKVDYNKSGLSEIQLELIHRKLKEIMNFEKPFKNSQFTLQELAQRLNITPNALSKIIYTLENKNFYDYLAILRIREFERVAIYYPSETYTLFALAIECGFKSKTAFNRTFKKFTGLSPSEHLKKVRGAIQG